MGLLVGVIVGVDVLVFVGVSVCACVLVWGPECVHVHVLI